MLSNAQFAQITGIPESAMPALPALGAHLDPNPNLTELALFTVAVEVDEVKRVGEGNEAFSIPTGKKAVHDLWTVKAKSATQMGCDLRSEQAKWAAEDEEKRQANLARYVKLAEQGFYESPNGEVSITSHAVHTK